jgi:glycine/D-amino acid oxidase-like deaminating enzyme
MNETHPTTNTAEAISLWDYSSPEPTVDNPLAGDVSVDVAIVGGGFTGLSTALHLRKQGVSCAVLEAQTVGYGGSGRNVGLVNAGLWLPPQDIRTQLGEEKGGALVQTLADAPAYVMSLIDEHAIQCEATRTGTIHAAHASSGLRDLEGRCAEWQRLGARVELIDANQTREMTGSSRFCGGLLDHRAGTINPMGYVRGLARAAIGGGAQLFTGTRVTKLARENNRWQLSTQRGTVSADAVILGTNAYTDALWPGLKQSFTMIHYFQLATEPLGDAGAHILPERQGVWNTAPIMFSVRRDAFGRLIMGSMGRIHGNESGLSSRWAIKQIKRYFPELPAVRIEKAWYGQIAMTPDHLPRIHRLADGLYTPIGYNGRGITPGTMFGKAMADLLSGGSEDKLPLPVTGLQTVGSAPVMSRVYGSAFAANQLFHSL